MARSATPNKRRCPFCSEALPRPSRRCPSCDEFLDEAFDSELAETVAAATRADVQSGEFERAGEGDYRQFRKSTVVALCLLGASLLLGVVGVAATAASKSDGLFGPLLATCGVLGGMGSFVALLVHGISDLSLPGPDALTEPETAFETYLRCLREKRWGNALALVVPRGRTGSRLRPEVPDLDAPEGEFDVDSPEGLAEYWKPLIHSTGAMSRRAAVGAVHVVPEGPDTAMAGCAITVTAVPTWVFNVHLYVSQKKTQTLPVEVGLMRVDGRWYLLDAVPRILADGR
jgi:hypothetical protein